MFISRFGKRPMHFFGVLGTLVFLIGLGATTYMGIYKLLSVYNGIRMERITQNPLFYIALTSMIIGTFLFLTGFLGELISRSSSDRNVYLIDKEL